MGVNPGLYLVTFFEPSRAVGQVSDSNSKITKLPPGETFGARDLQRWAQRRVAFLEAVRKAAERPHARGGGGGNEPSPGLPGGAGR